MSGRGKVLNVLFYQPPAGGWYVHSHKTYDSPEQAREAARKFLTPGVQIAVLSVLAVDLIPEKVKGFQQVSREEFDQFMQNYPRELTHDKCGISEPPLVTYSDFGAAKGWNAVVGKFHAYDNPAERVYWISEHLL